VQNTVVVSGLRLRDADLKTTGEIDFIVISLQLKSIIQIEAKRGNNQKNREHAEEQLKKGLAFFKENFSFPSSENWKYIKMMCFGESVEKDVCEKCKPFVLESSFVQANTIRSVSTEIASQLSTFLNCIRPDPSLMTRGGKIFVE
jgi:hypothetical protein